MMNARWFLLGLMGVTLACLITVPLACRKEEPPVKNEPRANPAAGELKVPAGDRKAEPPAKTQPSTGSPATPAAAVAGDLKVPAGFKAVAGTAAEPYSGTGWAKEVVHEATGIALVFIPAGKFTMGSPDGEKDRDGDEGPQREVTISRPFYMGRYEVTQGQWQKVTGANPSAFKGSDRLPVETVTWDDCQGFLRKAGGGLRLPTEAEWEYACRAGTKTRFSFGDEDAGLDACGWYTTNSGGKTHEVGGKRANGWGLHDMHGNVWEWCQDWYQDSYRGLGNADPTGPATGSLRVLRGGSWYDNPQGCRSAGRVFNSPDYRFSFIGCIGLRVVVSVGPGL